MNEIAEWDLWWMVVPSLSIAGAGESDGIPNEIEGNQQV